MFSKIHLVQITQKCPLREENHPFENSYFSDFCCVVWRKFFQRDSNLVYFSTLWRNKQYNIFSTLCVCKDSSEIYWNHLLAKITWNQWFYYWITLQVFFTKLWNSAVWNGKKYHCLLKKIVKSNWSLEKSRLHVIFTTKLWKIVRGNHALHMGVKITEIYSHTILTKISWK